MAKKPFEKGNPGGPGRPKGSGRNQRARAFAEQFGIPFLAAIAAGKVSKKYNLTADDVAGLTIADRKDAAKYLVDQGLGKAPQAVEHGPTVDSGIKKFTLSFET